MNFAHKVVVEQLRRRPLPPKDILSYAQKTIVEEQEIKIELFNMLASGEIM